MNRESQENDASGGALSGKPPTLADLGKLLGLSKRAVSQALNDRSGTVKVSEKTKDRVRALAKRMGYRQNMAATALSTGRTGLFGILAPLGRMHIHAIHLACAVDAFARHGISPIVIKSIGRQALENTLSTLIGARLDGLLLVDRQPYFADEHVAELQRFGVTIAQVGSTAPSPKLCHYWTDRNGSFALIIEHLVEQGVRDLTAMVSSEIGPPGSGQRDPAGNQTLVAILTAVNHMRNKGIDLKLRICAAPRLTEEEKDAGEVHPLYLPGYRAMQSLISVGEIPEALICQVDGWALGAMRACAEAGLRIPEDIAITGYSNEPACSATYVPLTSVEEPFEEMCLAAVGELVSTVREGRPLPPKSVVMPNRLVIRKSSLRNTQTPAAA